MIMASVTLITNSVVVIVSLIMLFKYDRYQRDSYQGIPGQDTEESEKLLRSGDGSDDDYEGSNAGMKPLEREVGVYFVQF